MAGIARWSILCVVCFQSLLLVACQGTENPPQWIMVSYGELVDQEQLTHSGSSLREILNELAAGTDVKSEVQPFVEPFASLLLDVLELREGPSTPPIFNLALLFPRGTPQPAWATLLREGRFIVAFDGGRRVVAFLPGDEPKSAYSELYGVLRHILNGLIPPSHEPLSVQIYAFENDFQRQQLRLNTVPYEFQRAEFPTPPGKAPLNLEGLRAFFVESPVLEGGSVSRESGLQLYGKKGDPQFLADQPISLSDLAVAYRAAVHAGNNTAYVSLDPHLDPTKVAVNFGGYLEDTAVGQVVLEADKQFKTLSTGLDPNTLRDIRSRVRTVVSGFLTSGERAIAGNLDNASGRWTGTRFWFYPDSIQVETDFDSRYARIISAHFTADAERSRDDFANPQQFERLRRSALSPAIQRSIEDLNARYPEYSGAFPVLQQLDVVARLMAISSWLSQLSTSDVDLDALMSVELPSFQTPRSRAKLIAVTTVTTDEAVPTAEEDVASQSIVTNLSTILDMPVGEHFDPNTASSFLAIRDDPGSDGSGRRTAAGKQLIESKSNSKVRELIVSEKDLQAMASEAASRIEGRKPAHLRSLMAQIDRMEAKSATMNASIEILQERMRRDVATHNQLLEKHNRLVNESNAFLALREVLVDRYNEAQVVNRYITQIGGGIDLQPRHFRVAPRRGSPLVAELQSKGSNASLRLETSAARGTWIRSNPTAGTQSVPTGYLRRQILLKMSKRTGDYFIQEYRVEPIGSYWRAKEQASDGWRDQLSLDDGQQRERYFDTETKELHIVDRAMAQAKQHVVASIGPKGSIVFRPSPRPNVADPGVPPFWASQGNQ